MLAETAQLDPTAVTVAIITGAFLVISTCVTGYFAFIANRRGDKTGQFLDDHVGETNGDGNLATMASESLHYQASHDLKDDRRFGALFDHAGIEDPCAGSGA